MTEIRKYQRMTESQKEKLRTTNKEWYRKLRVDVVAAYGGKCSCCGETTKEFLALDHVHGGGGAHTRKSGPREPYRDAKRRGFPSDYRLLCHNCNLAIGFYGKCPHEKNK